jgi:hypothetical protein
VVKKPVKLVRKIGLSMVSISKSQSWLFVKRKGVRKEPLRMWGLSITGRGMNLLILQNGMLPKLGTLRKKVSLVVKS